MKKLIKLIVIFMSMIMLSTFFYGCGNDNKEESLLTIEVIEIKEIEKIAYINNDNTGLHEKTEDSNVFHNFIEVKVSLLSKKAFYDLKFVLSDDKNKFVKEYEGSSGFIIYDKTIDYNNAEYQKQDTLKKNFYIF